MRNVSSLNQYVCPLRIFSPPSEQEAEAAGRKSSVGVDSRAESSAIASVQRSRLGCVSSSALVPTDPSVDGSTTMRFVACAATSKRSSCGESDDLSVSPVRPRKRLRISPHASGGAGRSADGAAAGLGGALHHVNDATSTDDATCCIQRNVEKKRVCLSHETF